jgi:hypothetical protein
MLHVCCLFLLCVNIVVFGLGFRVLHGGAPRAALLCFSHILWLWAGAGCLLPAALPCEAVGRWPQRDMVGD